VKGIGQKLILISFGLAVIAAGVVFAYLQSLKESEVQIKETTILVAADTIPPGTLITRQMIKQIQIPDNSILIDYIDDSSEIIGKYTKETILKNEGFHIDKLIGKDEGELRLRIDSTHRAVSINVTGDSGVSDLIKPGDSVDIVVFFAEIKDGQKVIRPELSKIILQNIKLLAIDKQLNRDCTLAESKENEEIPEKFLVTLSVTTTELEKLVLAENIGILKLALRPLNNDDMDETKGATWEELTAELKNRGEFSQEDNLKSNGENSNKFINYKVKPGDTLRKISREFYGDWKKYTIIKKANNIQDENLIITGQVIKIPEI